MSDTIPDLDKPAGPPTARAIRVPTTGKPKIISGPLKIALDLIVYGDQDDNGKPRRYTWQDAARKANYSLVSMRKALERQHVLRYLRDQKQVFRSHAAAGNIVRAVEIRDQDDNRTAAIQAIRYLDGDEQAARDGQRQLTPGVVVTVNVHGAGDRPPDETVIEVNPASPASEAASDEPGDGGGEP